MFKGNECYARIDKSKNKILDYRKWGVDFSKVVFTQNQKAS